MLSFDKPICKMRTDAKKAVNVDANRLYQKVMDEELRLHDCRQKEILSTLENPRLRDEADSTQISTELKELKRQQFLEQKRRQQLHANNEELRVLEMQLRCAYMTKELVAQQADHERMRQAEKHEKLEDAKRFESERLCTQEAFADKRRQEQIEKNHIRSLLHAQMAEVREQRMKEYEEVMRDRDDMQKLIQRMKNEDAAEREALMQRRRIERQEVDEYLHNRELYKLNEQAAKLEEHDMYMEMRKKRDDEERRKMEEKRREMNERIAANERIGQEIHDKQMEKQKRADLLTDLLVEERKALQDLKQRMQLQRQMKQRQETIAELNVAREQQMRNRTKPGEMSYEDKLFYDEEMRVLAERDKLDQLTNARRQRLLQEHRRGLLALIEERKAEHKQRTVENLYIDSTERRNEVQRLQNVEEERKRMLVGHSSEVLRYLPTNTLRADERKLLQQPTNDLNSK